MRGCDHDMKSLPHSRLSFGPLSFQQEYLKIMSDWKMFLVDLQMSYEILIGQLVFGMIIIGTIYALKMLKKLFTD